MYKFVGRKSRRVVRPFALKIHLPQFLTFEYQVVPEGVGTSYSHASRLRSTEVFTAADNDLTAKTIFFLPKTVTVRLMYATTAVSDQH
jgi:hypothetical protein